MMTKSFLRKYVIIRADRAGVFAGTLYKILPENKVVLTNCRRIWYWSGASSISQLAVDGTKDSSSCKFPAPVSSILISGVIEIIPCTKVAEKSIKDVKVWNQ